MKRVYCRCNGGHYFSGEVCPFDGWSSVESQAVAAAAERLAEDGAPPSIAALQEVGLAGAALARAIVIEFGSGAAAFDAVLPEGYSISGSWCPLEQAGRAFK